MTERQIQKEVQRQAVLFEEQVRNGQVSSDGRLKLADFVPMYLETAKQRLSPCVYERYTHIIDLGIIPPLGHVCFLLLRFIFHIYPMIFLSRQIISSFRLYTHK